MVLSDLLLSQVIHTLNFHQRGPSFLLPLSASKTCSPSTLKNTPGEQMAYTRGEHCRCQVASFDWFTYTLESKFSRDHAWAHQSCQSGPLCHAKKRWRGLKAASIKQRKPRQWRGWATIFYYQTLQYLYLKIGYRNIITKYCYSYVNLSSIKLSKCYH